MEIHELWNQCAFRLEQRLSDEEYHSSILPLKIEAHDQKLYLCAPNAYVFDQVQSAYLEEIKKLISHFSSEYKDVQLLIGSLQHKSNTETFDTSTASNNSAEPIDTLNPRYIFSNFVQGKSNEIARNAAWHVSEQPGGDFNPLFLYGGTGLGKTHLLHAVGHKIREKRPGAKVAYVSSERFVQNMISALQQGGSSINEFKQRYRSVDCLLIDDIQFIAGKGRSQEEFFHTFNTLMENQQQIVLTCDRFPKEMDNMEDRLRSRFGWGLSVAVEPPDFETRVAILQSKANQAGFRIDEKVAYFIAKHIRSHVRDLEGALNTLIATTRFTQRPLTTDYAKEILHDLLTVQERQLTIENIQRKVADYYKLRVQELKSSSRKRVIARPRQMAMWLTKELTNKSLPEIGEAFGGRDHTTVLHACKRIHELCQQDTQVEDDKNRLLRILTT